MKSVSRTHSFKRDYKFLKKTIRNLDDKFESVVHMLTKGENLPARHRDHPLSGDWKGFRDCHVMPDLVLIYSVSDTEVTLVRLGSHSALFG